ncbi:PPOX class F420-dependent oxidoreductase [Allonocardiopsis opalescens]|uniref:PPOX class probable F420-dependent enzyme n=1 Tax=Allonocardiopsis opalescens TaxID=1144618 RepID=A0A2T0Q474_9ACTN|nr:PPOX class F420-dependent oxidoreductase [Allonocardiopsis opalescens]PRX98592.1 PPOX class probable F420-dependent enzyme [Allonocardiopsis opalescens]
MPVSFDEGARRILDGRNFATVATLGPDGAPHTSVVWVLREGDTVLFSSKAERRKVRNLLRDPRVGLSVFDLADPYRSVDIRGTAEVLDDPERTLPVKVSHKYLGEDPPPEEGVSRVIVRVTPHRVTGFTG